MRIMVFGASGMIGNAIFRVLSEREDWEVLGTVRNESWLAFFPEKLRKMLVIFEDAQSAEGLNQLLSDFHPDVVINCIGLTKHHKEAEDATLAVPLNALLPHQIAKICKRHAGRLIHISTDCVFSGRAGKYTEDDTADAIDLYGKSKHIGELIIDDHVLVLRTSTIGHELNSKFGLLEWFLAQKDVCKGFDRAIFSGLPNNVFAEIIRDLVIPNGTLHGLYHLGGGAINKHDLLGLIARRYDKQITIKRESSFEIDRSFASEKFSLKTGYAAAPWPDLIDRMYEFHNV